MTKATRESNLRAIVAAVGMTICCGVGATQTLMPFTFGDIVPTQGIGGTFDYWYCLRQCTAMVDENGVASQLGGAWLPLGGLDALPFSVEVHPIAR